MISDHNMINFHLVGCYPFKNTTLPSTY